MSNFPKDVVNSINEITFNNDLFGDPNESYDQLENAIINADNNNFQPKYTKNANINYPTEWQPASRGPSNAEIICTGSV